MLYFWIKFHWAYSSFTLVPFNFRWKRRKKKKVHVNRERTCSKFLHFGHGHAGVCEYFNDLGMYFSHAVSLAHPKSHWDASTKLRQEISNSNKFPKTNTLTFMKQEPVLFCMWACAYAFYLSPSSQSSDNTEGKRKVQVYFCYWGWGWGKTLIKAGLAGTTPNETLLKISLPWPSWVAMRVRSLTFRCACKHAQAQYDTKLAIKSTTVRLANTYSFL